MHRTSHVTRVAVVLAALVTAIGLGGSGTANPPPASARTGVPSGRCPHHALRLPGIGAAHAAEKALHRAASDYPGTDTHGASIQAADRSAFAGARGREVRQQCGAAVARRTVVVQLFFPRMLPSASLSQGVVFVARFPRGYRVWEIAH